MRDWTTAPLSKLDHELCAYARKLTHGPSEIDDADLDRLRRLGLDDRGLHDATQIIALFNYYPRVADGLGIELEDFVRPWGELGLSAEVPPRDS